MAGKFAVQSLDHLVLSVADIEVSKMFYSQVLGMESEVFHPTDGTTRHALAFGAQKINLHDAAIPFAHMRRTPHPALPICVFSVMYRLLTGRPILPFKVLQSSKVQYRVPGPPGLSCRCIFVTRMAI